MAAPTVGELLAMHGVETDDLEHHGRLGMKWGKHIFGKGPSDGRLTSTPKAASKPGTHPDHRTAHTLEKKPIHQLGNRDIQTINARLNMEKQLNTLKAEKSTFNKGHSYVKSVLAVAGTATAAVALGIRLANTPAGKALIKKGAIYLRAAHVANLG